MANQILVAVAWFCKRMNDSGHWKGGDHALDHIRDSLDFVAAGIDQWLHDWWIYSHPAGHRHRRGGDSSDSGTKIIVAIWTLASNYFTAYIKNREE